MDGIQATSSKANPTATPGAAANDDDSVAGAFAALLDLVGARVKAIDTGAALDTKLVRGDEEAKARANADRDAAAKARNDKDDDRATAAKSKTDKTRGDEDTDDAKAASNDDTAEDTADAAQTPDGQTAAQVAATVAADVPLVTTEAVAPVLIAQQVQTAADTGAVAQTAVDPVTTVTDTAVETETAVVDPAAGQKTAVVEAPAAVQKTAEAAGPAFKQAAVETAGPAQVKTAAAAATDAPVVATEGEAAKTKETAQVNATTQRSAAAQAQSQDLSQKVGPDTKAQVLVTVTTHAAAQTANANGVYDIYAGYNGAQASTANGQVGVSDAGNALVGSKTPAEAAQAQAASSASPALAPQPQTQASQQGTSSSAIRADFAAPTATQAGSTGGQTSASFGESAFGTSTPSNQASATTAGTPTTATERPMATAQQIIDQIKVNITRAAKAGLDKVTIQLKPVELGRIDVHLEMSEDHKVRVTVTADHKDTLTLLQNDARTLERTLNDAGLRTDANNLHFSLRSESDAQTASDGRSGGRNPTAEAAGATTNEDDIAMTYDYTAAARARGGVDTFA